MDTQLLGKAPACSNTKNKEVTPKHAMEEKARRVEAEKLAAMQNPGIVNGVDEAASGANGIRSVEPNGERKHAQDPYVDVFEGTFDGALSSRYAITVMTEGSKTVEVVPIDEYAWFSSFRATISEGADDTEVMEAHMRRFTTKGRTRMSRFHIKLEAAQGAREQSMGENTRIKTNNEYTGVGSACAIQYRRGDRGKKPQ